MALRRRSLVLPLVVGRSAARVARTPVLTCFKLHAPPRFDEISHGLVVSSPESFADTGPAADPYQLQVASTIPAVMLFRSRASLLAMLFR